ncbi:MAG TPA: helix-turn-helix domain-containing protein [Ktedonobacteraceae bacterium]
MGQVVARASRDVEQPNTQNGKTSITSPDRPQTASDNEPQDVWEAYEYAEEIPEEPAKPSMSLRRSLRSSTPPPSVRNYGSIVIADGFTQHPRSVEDYLNTLDLCATEKQMILILESYRHQTEQECFPAVGTLSQRCQLGKRRVNQVTAHLSDLGLLIKRARFAAKRQLSNYYDLEPLYEKVAAWKDAEVARELAQQKARAAEPFVPMDAVEQAAQAVSEEFGEPETSQILYNARRITRRFSQHPQLNWQSFFTLMTWAEHETAQRSKQLTNTNKTFQNLVSYFFSALDYRLACKQGAQEQGAESFDLLSDDEQRFLWETEDTQQSEQAEPVQWEDPYAPSQQSSPLNPAWENEQPAGAPTQPLEQAESVQWQNSYAPSQQSSPLNPAWENEQPAGAPTQPLEQTEPVQRQDSYAPSYARRNELPTGITQPQTRPQTRKNSGARIPTPPALKCSIEAAALTFRDQQVKSSLRRATNLMTRAGLDEATMCRLVADARAVTSQGANIRHRMPYFFRILEEFVRDNTAHA